MRALSGTMTALLVGLGLQGCGSDEPDPTPVAPPRGGSAGDATGGTSPPPGGPPGGSSGAHAEGGTATGGSGGAQAEGGSAGMVQGGDPSGSGGEAVAFTQRVVTDGLSSPWELVLGPDDWLWITERTAKRVVRVRPSDGLIQVAAELDEVQVEGSQDGILGMALHPELGAGTAQDFVYVAYSYDGPSGRRFKLRRYTYDATSGSLSAPRDLLTELPASSDHNGGRLRIGPDAKLYYSIGDQGENQFDRKCNLNRAQALPTAEQVSAGDYQAYQGKILRLNLDGSIPEDNPVLGGVRSHVWSFGHRNPQGLAFGPTGALFSSEQGPKTDDELNRIEPGRNYGWPHVAGFQDDRAYVYANWSAAPGCAQLPYSDYELPGSVPRAPESEWRDATFAPPLQTFYTVDSTHDFQDPKCGGNANICWPTIAPSSLEFDPTANGALLIPSLKHGTVYRLPLTADGAGVLDEVTPLFKTTNRYRDVAVSPDGRAFYVLTDSSGATSSLDGGATSELDDPGSLLAFE